MTLISFFYILAIFVGLVVTQEIFHRYPKFSLVFFIITSIILFPCWILLIGVADWFAWLKVFSIASGIIVLSLFRVTRLGDTKLLQWTVFVFLVVNILEAVMKDVATGGIANYFNALAGILLIVTLNKINTIHIDTRGGYRDLHWSSMTLAWIIGYTIWNWVFVYFNFGFQSSLAHIAVLASALIVGFIDKERWLQARVFTLGTYFVMLGTYSSIFNSFPHSDLGLLTSGYNEQFGLVMSLIALGFMLAYTIFFLRNVIIKN